MTHSLSHDEISAYLDGALEADRQRQVEQHVEKCAPCRTLLADLRTMSAAMAAEPVPGCPADLADRISVQVRAGTVGGRRRWLIRGGQGLGLAAALAAAAVLWTVWQSPLPPDQTAVPESAVARLEEERPLQDSAGARQEPARTDDEFMSDLDAAARGAAPETALPPADTSPARKRAAAILPESVSEAAGETPGHAVGRQLKSRTQAAGETAAADAPGVDSLRMEARKDDTLASVAAAPTSLLWRTDLGTVRLARGRLTVSIGQNPSCPGPEGDAVPPGADGHAVPADAPPLPAGIYAMDGDEPRLLEGDAARSARSRLVRELQGQSRELEEACGFQPAAWLRSDGSRPPAVP